MAETGTRKWWILAVVTLVAFVTNLDGTIVVVGLPRMVAGLHTTVTTGLWTLTAYIITSTVFLLPAGRWSDMVGRKRIFLAGLAIFGVATFFCGISPSGSLLLVFRFVQGVGAALALATATPIIVSAFPPQQLGRALGINSTAWVMGSIVGPVVGGLLVSTWGWRWIFFVAIPFALIGVIGAMAVLEEPKQHQEGQSDLLGAVTFGLGLVGLLLVLSLGQGWGWLSFRTVGALAVSILCFVLFWVIERHSRDPMFNLALLNHRHYRAGLGVTILYAIGFFATTFLLTIYLQGAVHLSPIDAGLMLVPLSLPQLVLAPVGGSLADRYGSPVLVMVGLALLAVAGFWLGHLPTRFSPWPVILPLLLMSAANGTLWPALTKAVMSSAPREHTGSASGMFFTFRNVGMALSLTLALMIAEVSLPTRLADEIYLGTAGILRPAVTGALVHATNVGFWVFVGFYLLALATATTLVRPHATEAAKESYTAGSGAS
ncbi:MAG: MFS transporter [Firmicutes bacterium]|nr:MFS transporter [Bacillota bacterium]